MVTVQPAVGDDIDIALRFLTQQLPAEEQRQQIAATLSAAAAGELSLDGLLLARRDHRPVGALLTLLQDGGCASLWPPEVAVEQDVDVADALLQSAIGRLSSANVTFIQSIVEREELEGRRLLDKNGVPYLTDLVFMERNLNLAMPECGAELEFITYDQQTHRQFVDLLQRTYRATLDCPELDGMRTAEQALEGHRGTGTLHPEYWRLFRRDGNDVGVLLLSEHADQRAWELVYMGVAPEARGKGIGRDMLAMTLPLLPQQTSPTIFLAVDARNHYATAAYERIGFEVIATRALHLRLSGSRGAGRN